MDGVRKKSLKEVLPKSELPTTVRRGTVRKGRGIEAEVVSVPPPDRAPVRSELPVRDRRRKNNLGLYLVGTLILLAVGYFLSVVFSSAIVKITPRSSRQAVDGRYEASLGPANGLEFSVMKLDQTISKPVAASSQVKTRSRAKGTVTIANLYSSASQKLVAGTRLSADDGKIYRLDSSITVPGLSNSGGKVVPGSIKTAITADNIGPAYNQSNLKMKIVGFQGTAKYDKFTVSGEATGGSDGLSTVVSEADKQQAIQAAQTELRESLQKKALAQIPKDYFIFPQGIDIKYSSRVRAESASSSVIEVTGQLNALMFNQDKIAQTIAGRLFPNEAVEGVQLDLSGIVFALLGSDVASAATAGKITFTLAGPGNFVWPVDKNELAQRLKGIKFSQRDAIFSTYPNIYRIEARIKPFWIRSFPANPRKIIIQLIK
ncbi:MAG: hypothetical protein NTY66_03105 [Candidatus Vogelbacteria bacterium]|nr:hypothetical protein [Candidatus Vogelbacteria bacterium]